MVETGPDQGSWPRPPRRADVASATARVIPLPNLAPQLATSQVMRRRAALPATATATTCPPGVSASSSDPAVPESENYASCLMPLAIPAVPAQFPPAGRRCVCLQVDATRGRSSTRPKILGDSSRTRALSRGRLRPRRVLRPWSVQCATAQCKSRQFRSIRVQFTTMLRATGSAMQCDYFQC